MKKPVPVNLLGAIVRDYFTDHLPRIRGSSPHTILSYRDSIVLLLRFVAEQRKIPVVALDLADLDPPRILAFLSHLEDQRKNGVATRNVRLAAIHALFRFVASRNPEQLDLAQKVIAIPFKRAPSRAIDYLEYEEIDSILKVVDRTTPQGVRDYALLATMFNTGGRVQEIVNLRFRDLQLIKPFQVRLFGKGRKERYCPIWPETAAVLRSFCKQRKIECMAEAHLFVNHRGQPLSRFGVRYILSRCLDAASEGAPTLAKKRLHPHSMRHYLPFRIMSRRNRAFAVSHRIGSRLTQGFRISRDIVRCAVTVRSERPGVCLRVYSGRVFHSAELPSPGLFPSWQALLRGKPVWFPGARDRATMRSQIDRHLLAEGPWPWCASDDER